jgi:hypothetical protein
MSRVLTTFGDDSNPMNSIVIPLALADQTLMQILLTLLLPSAEASTNGDESRIECRKKPTSPEGFANPNVKDTGKEENCSSHRLTIFIE